MSENKSFLRQAYTLMQRARSLEERLIKLYRTGDAFFWIGGPGEEAFGVALGLLAKKGQGPDFDYMHLHYRCTPTLIAFGMSMVDAVRLMLNRATDRCTRGRNFSSHYCFPEWNVLPVTSPIGVQYGIALGTALAQKRGGTNGISVVTGGDAGTAESDFASCLVWSSRKGQELPILITVQNNGWGISTSYNGQHASDSIAARAKGYNIPSVTVDGNDFFEVYDSLAKAYQFVRDNKKPFLLEAKVSRLYGHSSASGANRDPGAECCLERFSSELVRKKVLSKEDVQSIRSEAEAEALEASYLVRGEPHPEADSIWEDVFVGNENSNWREF